jgi:asparagine synthase (glutamine-hydrolysing)
LLVVGDVRLYNRQDVASALGRGDLGRSDLFLVREAYARWGPDAVERFIGDFAFVIWDGRARRVTAARDHLGVRPLCYRLDSKGGVVASDVDLVLAGTPERFRLNPERMLDYLSDDYAHHGQTFFAGVNSLKPAHVLAATRSGATETRYWFPPPESTTLRSYGDVCEAFSDVFRTATRDRLESEHPIVAHASGGFDSSTIVVVADEAYASAPERPPLTLASATMKGLRVDETDKIDALARSVRFPSFRWNARAKNDLDFREPLLVAPGLRRGVAGGPLADLDHARERGARVLLNGFGGDEVSYARGIFRELVRRLQWGTLVSEAMSFPLRRGLRFLADSWRGLVPPHYADRWRGRWPGRPRKPPPWLGPELRSIYPGQPDSRDGLEGYPWRSYVQRDLWRVLNDPRVSECIDVISAQAAHAGLEARMPYVDVRLIELVLSIPVELRRPGGDMRRLQRDALSKLLPPEIAARPGQVPFDTVWTENTRLLLPCVRALVEEGEWLSAPFVSRREAANMLATEEARGEMGPWRAMYLVASIGIAEAWTREVLRFYTSRSR